MNDSNRFKTTAAVIFFGLYGFFFFIFAKYMFFLVNQAAFLPFIPSLIAAIITGCFIGYLFGNQLTRELSTLRLFATGCLIGLMAIFLIGIDTIIYLYLVKPVFFINAHSWQDYAMSWGLITLSVFLTMGPWLLPITGLAVIYFNKRFFPRLYAIDSKQTKI